MKEIRVRMAYGMPRASGAGIGVRLETLKINNFPYTRKMPWRHGWAMWTQLDDPMSSLGSCRL